MQSQDFIIKISAPDDEFDALYPADVANVLRASMEYSPTSLYIESVEKFDPAAFESLRKIPAIKRLRELLGCSLKDAKFLADSAERDGSASWSTVTITYLGDQDFRVTSI